MIECMWVRDDNLLPAGLINLMSGITSLKAMAGVRKQEYSNIFTELEAVAKVSRLKVLMLLKV